MDNEITVQEELESTAAEIPADAVEESETERAPRLRSFSSFAQR